MAALRTVTRPNQLQGARRGGPWGSEAGGCGSPGGRGRGRAPGHLALSDAAGTGSASSAHLALCPRDTARGVRSTEAAGPEPASPPKPASPCAWQLRAGNRVTLRSAVPTPVTHRSPAGAGRHPRAPLGWVSAGCPSGSPLLPSQTPALPGRTPGLSSHSDEARAVSQHLQS